MNTVKDLHVKQAYENSERPTWTSRPLNTVKDLLVLAGISTLLKTYLYKQVHEHC